MIGISCYTDYVDEEYIKDAKEAGADLLYTSLVYALKKNQLAVLPKITEAAIKFGFKIIADCNKDIFSQIPLQQLLAWGINGIRFDEFDESLDKFIQGCPSKVTIYYNASQFDTRMLTQNREQTNFLYNFYPMEKSGMSSVAMEKTNKTINNKFKVGAFIPGDVLLRGPIYKGLPTLERHRYMNPYVAGCDLYLNHKINDLIIGDKKVRISVLNALRSLQRQGEIRIPVYFASDKGKIKFELRKDYSKYIFRSLDRIEVGGENYFSRLIKQGTIFTYPKGNAYSGVIHIARKDFISDEMANLIGFVHPHFVELLHLNLSGLKVELVDQKHFTV